LAECADDYCPEGTYFDGWSCYDCSYCVNTNDDSACDSPNDCCGACGDSADGDCGSLASNNGNISFAATKAKIDAAVVYTHNPSTVVNIATGEITYSDDYQANRAVSYDVTFSCEACFDVDGDGILDDWAGLWSTSDPEFLVYGFETDDNVCVTVTGVSTELGVTDTSDAVCAAAGGCDDADSDGICDDVDDCVGQYDDCGNCNGDNMCFDLGDVNMDGSINVTDIVAVVSYIVNGSDGDLAYSDMNGDGSTNVTDIVAIVNIIMGGTARVDGATDATITIAGNLLSVEGNGFIQGAQLTLTHQGSISIDLANEFVADYRTSGNTTTLVIATDGTHSLTDIATISGNYEITESIIVNSTDEVHTQQVLEVAGFELKAAYPNPFNPITSLGLVIPEAGFVSVKVYNLMGQEVATLVEGMMQPTNNYTMTWNASNMSSGVYLVRAEGAGSVATQKLMLLK
jgi:hypothetical protein